MYILIRFIYSIHIIQVLSFVCVLTWSLLGIKKSLGHAQIGLLQGFNSKFPTSIPTPFICGVPPGLKLHFCFPLTLADIHPCPLVPSFQISLKNSELKTTHNTYRDCRVHFFGQPFSKQLYIEDVSKFHQEALTITAVLAILVGPLSSFNPCPSLPSVATDDCRKHFQCLLFCLK